MYEDHEVELLKVVNVAKELYQKIYAVDSPNECKSMALRILGFNFEMVSDKVQKAIAKMNQFFLTSYKGVTCSLCNAKNHKFIDFDKKMVSLDKQFCRETVENSLLPMLYLHKHFREFHNLAINFVNQCDDDGNFTKKEAKEDQLLKLDEKNVKAVTTCRDFRNNCSWLQACEDVCNKVHLVTFSSFFAPDIKQYTAVTAALKKILEEEGKDAPLPGAAGAKAAATGKDGADKKTDTKKPDEKKADEKKADEKKTEEKKADPKTSKQGRILSRLRHRRYSRMLKDEAAKPKTPKTPATKDPAAKPDEKKPATEAKKTDAAKTGDAKDAEAAGPPNPQTLADKIKVYSNVEIFLFVNTDIKAMSKFKTQCLECKGFNPLLAGQMADFDAKLYAEIKASSGSKAAPGAPAGDAAKTETPDAAKKEKADATGGEKDTTGGTDANVATVGKKSGLFGGVPLLGQSLVIFFGWLICLWSL